MYKFSQYSSCYGTPLGKGSGLRVMTPRQWKRRQLLVILTQVPVSRKVEEKRMVFSCFQSRDWLTD